MIGMDQEATRNWRALDMMVKQPLMTLQELEEELDSKIEEDTACYV